jgi:hypothetical protein
LIRGCFLPSPGRFILLLRRFLSWELVFKFRHPDFSAAEFHAFHFQSKALVKAAFTGDRNTPSGGHHAMPGQSLRLAQCTDHKARASGNAGRASDGSIAGDMAARDLQDRRADTLKFRVWLPCFSHRHILNRGKDRRHHEHRSSAPDWSLSRAVAMISFATLGERVWLCGWKTRRGEQIATCFW